MTRRLVILALVLALLGAFAWALWPSPIIVDTATIARQSITVEVEEEGTAQIREVFTVSSPIAGQMLRGQLHAGDRVVAGETVVARISPVAPALLDQRSRKVAEATLQAAEAALGLAEAELSRAKSQLAFRQADATRATALREKGTISDRDLDLAMLDLDAAEAALASAKANLAVRERERDSASAVLAAGEGEVSTTCCTEIRAPASGRVLRVLVESEQVVQPGEPLLEIGDPADMEIVVELLSSDAVRIAPGAVATVEGWGGAALAAKVQRIEPAATTKVSALGIEEQRVKLVLVLTGDPATWAGLGDGYRVTLRITVWNGEDLTAIPIGALFRAGSDWATYVVKDGRATLRRITLGERNDRLARVLTGLEPGDVVILHPNDQIAEGAAVTALIP